MNRRTSLTSTSQRPILLGGGLIVVAALAAYHNTFDVTFLLDDWGAIAENSSIRKLWPILPSLSPPPDGLTVSGRPLLNLSFAINYAISRAEVWSYHAANLLIHLGAGLLLFGIVRRTFLTAALRERFGPAATALALIGALLWTVHPLQTESVTYLVQRAESLAGFFYLLTLYCVIRGAHGFSPLPEGEGTGPGTSTWLWYAAAVLACLLGMATKEIMVTAPLTVLLYDRTFLSRSFAGALRRRWGLYLGLAATWGLLAYLVLSLGMIQRQAEFGAPSVGRYALTQLGVLLDYLRLAVWPRGLCLHCLWPVASSLPEILPGALVIGCLLGATVWGLLARRSWAFLGAWFFLILAPTSSLFPISDLRYEHRIYLSLAAVTVLFSAGGYALWDRWAPQPAAPELQRLVLRWALPAAASAIVLLALGAATVARNNVYRSPQAIYQDTLDKSPGNWAAHNNLGITLGWLGRTEEARQHFREALRLNPRNAEAHNNLGRLLADMGQNAEAIEHYQQAVQLMPYYARAHNNLGDVLARVGRIDEARAHYQEALRLRPDLAPARNGLGNVLLTLGRTAEAIEQFRESLRLEPGYATAHNDLAVALDRLGRTDEAREHFDQALRLQPDDAEAHYNLGNVLASFGKDDEATAHYQQAVRLKPDDADAHNNLGVVLGRQGKKAEAIEHLQEVVRLKPASAEAHCNLGIALTGAGKIEEAAAQFHEAVRLKPDFADAHCNLGIALFALGKSNEAVEQFQRALELKPALALAHYHLANALAGRNRSREAVEHYERALEQMPDSLKILNNLAWLLATREPQQGGDPARALQLAQRAQALNRQDDLRCLDTLAAACAAAGRFDEAVAAATRAAQCAESTGQTALAGNIGARLELYRAGQPCRQIQGPPEHADR